MLYGDYIDLNSSERERSAAQADTAGQLSALLGRLDAARRPRHPGPDAPGVAGHGTGVSTVRPLPARSFTPRAIARAVRNPDAWAFAFAVLGNMVAGALFLGALLLAPQLLGRLAGLL